MRHYGAQGGNLLGIPRISIHNSHTAYRGSTASNSLELSSILSITPTASYSERVRSATARLAALPWTNGGRGAGEGGGRAACVGGGLEQRQRDEEGRKQGFRVCGADYLK